MEKIMKKMVSLAIIMVMALSMIAGCSSKQEPATASSGSETKESVSQESKTEEVAETVAAETAEKEDESGKTFNPDTETDAISCDDLEGKFGALADLELPGDISIGGILKNQANEFWLALGNGMTSAAEESGAKIDIQATRTETDTAGQLSIAETMLQNNYSALILSPLTNECLDNAVTTAKDAGIPIVNANCEYVAGADVFVGGLQIEIGHKAADYIAEKIGKKGKVAIIEGVSGTFTSIQRVNGFNEQIAQYPDIEVVASVPADYEMEKGMNVATDILTSNEDISAIYCCNDNMALGAVEALRNAGKLGEVVVLGVDGTGDAYKSIHAGELNATVDQFPEINGEVAVEVALRLLAGQEIPRVVSTPIEVVDEDNASEFGK